MRQDGADADMGERPDTELREQTDRQTRGNTPVQRGSLF